jgi:hypothetical protein
VSSIFGTNFGFVSFEAQPALNSLRNCFQRRNVDLFSFSIEAGRFPVLLLVRVLVRSLRVSRTVVQYQVPERYIRTW